MSKAEIVAERRFVRWVKDGGGDAIKLSTQGAFGRRGRNDRLVMMPGKFTALVEFKKEGEEPTALQDFTHRLYRKMGFPVFVAHSFDSARRFIEKERKRIRT